MSNFLLPILSASVGLIWCTLAWRKSQADAEENKKFNEDLARPLDWSSLSDSVGIRQRLRSAYLDKATPLSLTCRRCGELASPTPNSGNRYRCSKCKNQFAGPGHGMKSFPFFEALPEEMKLAFAQECGFARHDILFLSKPFVRLVEIAVSEDAPRPIG